MFWALLRTQKRSDKRRQDRRRSRGCVIASGAPYTRLKITRPRRSSRVRKATSETPHNGLEITAARRVRDRPVARRGQWRLVTGDAYGSAGLVSRQTVAGADEWLAWCPRPDR